jgi:Domain of unknown function (DUF4136)
MMSKSFHVTGWLFAISLIIAACEATPRIRTQLAPGDVFSDLRTYDYFDRLGTDKYGYTTITTAGIEAAVDREMRRRGYTRGRNPQMLVNANIYTHDKIRSIPGFGYGAGFGGWRDGFGYGGWENWEKRGNDLETVTEGTLTIDVVNRSIMQLAWTGSATSILNSKTLDQPQPAIDRAVMLIFATFPTTNGKPL